MEPDGHIYTVAVSRQICAQGGYHFKVGDDVRFHIYHGVVVKNDPTNHSHIEVETRWEMEPRRQ